MKEKEGKWHEQCKKSEYVAHRTYVKLLKKISTRKQMNQKRHIKMADDKKETTVSTKQ